jgi:hypothetical protein
MGEREWDALESAHATQIRAYWTMEMCRSVCTASHSSFAASKLASEYGIGPLERWDGRCVG